MSRLLVLAALATLSGCVAGTVYSYSEPPLAYDERYDYWVWDEGGQIYFDDAGYPLCDDDGFVHYGRSCRWYAYDSVRFVFVYRPDYDWGQHRGRWPHRGGYRRPDRNARPDAVWPRHVGSDAVQPRPARPSDQPRAVPSSSDPVYPSRPGGSVYPTPVEPTRTRPIPYGNDVRQVPTHVDAETAKPVPYGDDVRPVPVVPRPTTEVTPSRPTWNTPARDESVPATRTAPGQPTWDRPATSPHAEPAPVQPSWNPPRADEPSVNVPTTQPNSTPQWNGRPTQVNTNQHATTPTWGGRPAEEPARPDLRDDRVIPNATQKPRVVVPSGDPAPSRVVLPSRAVPAASVPAAVTPAKKKKGEKTR